MTAIKKPVNHLISIVVVVSGFAAAPVVQADEPGWYLRAHGGLSNLDDTSGRTTATGSDAKLVLSTDSGSFLGMAGGYNYGNGWRAEVAWDYRSNDSTGVIDGIDVFTAGDYASNTFFLNGVYGIDIGSPWRPYLGAGLAWVQEIDVDLEADGTEQSYSSSGEVGFQAFAGVDYPISSQWVINFELRYTNIGAIDLDAEAEAFGTVTGLDYAHTSLQIGLTYRF